MTPDTGMTDNEQPNKPSADPSNFMGKSQQQIDDDLQQEFAEFDQALDMYLPGGQNANRGELREFEVVEITETRVLVDVGGKAEGSVDITEFPIVDGKPSVQVGDKITVLQMGQSPDGTPRLSYRQARAREAQGKVREAMEAKQPVKGIVRDVVKGGVMVDIGLDAFMPASQVDLFKIPDLKELVGKEVEAYVTEFDGRRNRAVLSRRKLLVEQREGEKSSFLTHLEKDQEVTGTVKSCLDFGVFVDLGIVDGFVPREEVSWDRGKAPTDILKPGDTVALKILSVSSETGKVTLSRKRLQINPWDGVGDRFKVGGTLRGKIVAVENYGAFVQIEEGLTGMIHASDMSWASGNKKPEDYVRLGEEVTCQILEVNVDKKRISLGLKQLAEDPWTSVERKFAPGTRHKGKVESIAAYGAFIRLDDYVEGMVHVSDLSWEKRVNHPKDHLKVGEEVNVTVLKIDREKRRISLGIKQITDSPYDAYLKAHPVGSVVTGKVTRFAPFGVFVELAPSLEGLIHISQLDDKRVEVPESVVAAGETVTVKIVSAERKNQKISLSRKEAVKAMEKETLRGYLNAQDTASPANTLGEALRAAQKKQQGS